MNSMVCIKTGKRAAFFAALLIALVSNLSPAVSAPSDTAISPPLKAKWIWLPQDNRSPYNQTIIARKTVRLKNHKQATIRIAADTFYRLLINDRWVNDGPCRSWPTHFQYDVLDVSPYLVEGRNEIRVIARYYGVGDFHHIPQQAGLLAQLDVTMADGRTETVITDDSWETARAAAWIANTPKVSIQMAPAELYDARLETPTKFVRAKVLFGTEEGPWKKLAPRDVALLTRQPFALKSFLGAKVVKAEALNFCLPAARLANPGLIEANRNVSCAGGMASVVVLESPRTVQVQSEGFKYGIGGRQSKDGTFQLPAGRHLVLAFVRDVTGHEKEKSLRILNPAGLSLENPVDPKRQNPWCYLRFPEATFATNDLAWHLSDIKEITEQVNRYKTTIDQLITKVTEPAAIQSMLKDRVVMLDAESMFVQDSAWQFWQRRVVGDGAAYVEYPDALMHETPVATVVRPAPEGDVELLYDLGEQNCGYYSFELRADAGVALDLFEVEYIAPDGRVQYSFGNRNGMRYITKQGPNQFTSLKRRSGRYLFVTLRNLKSPVAIRI